MAELIAVAQQVSTRDPARDVQRTPVERESPRHASYPRRDYTHDEYFAFLAESDEKLEYRNGEIVPMAGAKVIHDDIAGNIFASIHTQVRGTNCKASSSDMLVRLEAANCFVFPDVSVTCGERQVMRRKDGRDALLNPTLIIEVLSDSTEAEDRGQKFHDYATLPSLQTYVVVSQNEPRIERFTRQPNGDWLLTTITAAGAELPLPAVGCTLALDEVYEGVTFEKLENTTADTNDEAVSAGENS